MFVGQYNQYDVMELYLPIALLFAATFFFLSYFGYKKSLLPIVFWGGLIMMVTLRLMTSLHNGIWYTDEAEWVSLAYRLPYCDTPYKCFDAHSTGYLGILVLKSFSFLGIEYNYTTVRLFGLFLLMVPTVFFFYRALRILYPKEEVILGLLLLFHYLLFGAHSIELFAYNTEYVIMFLSAAIYYCYILYTQRKRTIPLFIAALCIGILPFCKLQSLPIAFGFTVLFFIYFFRSRKFNHLLLFSGIGIVPLVITVLWFWQLGVLGDFWKMYVESNSYLVKYYSAGGWIYRFKVFVYVQRWLIPYYFIASLPLFFGLLQRRISFATLKKLDFGLIFLLCCCYISVGVTGSGAGPYVTLIIIPLFLVIVNLFSVLEVATWLKREKLLGSYSLLLTVMATLFLILPELGPLKARLTRFTRPSRDNVASYVQRQIPVGKPVSVLGNVEAVELYVKCKRPPATRTVHIIYLQAKKDTALMKYYQDQFMTDLEVSKPYLFVDPVRALDSPYLRPVRQYILDKYRLDTIIDDCQVYKRAI